MTGLSGKPFEYLSKEPFETEYGVDGFVKERRDRERGTFAAFLVSGIVLCVLSSVPIFAAMILPSTNEAGEAPRYGVAVSLLLVMVGVGVYLIIRASVRRDSCAILLQEGDYSEEKKEEQKRTQTLSAVYWGVVTAGYLGYSFVTMDWKRSWIVWPVAAVLYGVVVAIFTAVKKNGGK